MRGALALTALLLLGCTAPTYEASPEVLNANQQCETSRANYLYYARVSPLIESSDPTSCARCHLPGVDYRFLVQPDPCRAIACMNQEGLIDFEAPEDSKFLDWVRRGHAEIGLTLEEDPLVQREYYAFADWFDYHATCHTEICPTYEEPCADPDAPIPPPDMPADMPADMSQDMSQDMPVEMPVDLPPDLPPPELNAQNYGCEQLNQAFFDHVWPWNGRCYHCHSEFHASRQTSSPTPWMSNKRDREGSDHALRQASVLGFFDLEPPDQSRFLLKPLSEQLGGLPHVGGTKMRDLEDPMYVPSLAFIELMASCRSQE